jgi:glycogen synthase
MSDAIGGRTLGVAVLSRVIYPLHGYGGLQRHVYDLVRSLVARDVDVTLITQPPLRDHPTDPATDPLFRHARLTLKTVPYYTFPFAGRRGTTILDRITAYPWFGWRAGRLAAALADRGAVDVVHGLGAASLGFALARPRPGRRRVPFVFNPQGLEEFGATDPSRAPMKRIAYRPLQWAVRACARAADVVIATDNVLVEPVLTHLRVPPAAVRMLPNAIEVGECDRPDARERAGALRRSVGLEPDDLLLVSVGRLEANKGFHVLADALARLVQSGRLPRSWRWVLVGDGPMRSELGRIVAARGLDPHTCFRGRTDDGELHGWYEAATVFVHPTLYEGSSLVTLEAMAHRRAIVATRAGGLPDKVAPGVNGWLVGPGDPVALADAVADAVSDRTRLRAMGDASRRIVDRDFSWPSVTERLLALYEELVASTATSPRTPRPGRS